MTGGFSSEAISESDLAAGRFDGAQVALYLVNWQAPEQHVLLNMREIGEVTRAGGAFRAELRSIAHRLPSRRAGSMGGAAMPPLVIGDAASISSDLPAPAALRARTRRATCW